MKKTFVLDTNVLIHDPEAIFSFEENEVVIPITVIEELDGLKKGTGITPYSAREALRIIDSCRNGGGITTKGAALKNGGLLRLMFGGKKTPFFEKTPDNRIISVANDIKKENGRVVVLVSKDTAVRIKADSLGITAQDYKKDKTDLFRNYGNVLQDSDHSNGILSVRYQMSGSKIYRLSGEINSIEVERERSIHKYNILAKNVEQECAIDALRSPEINIVALTGVAGSGKTLLSLAVGLSQIEKNDPLFKQLIVTRPVIPMGGRESDLGFLPGDLDEKLDPWIQPIFDNLDVIIKPREHQLEDKEGGNKYRACRYLIESGLLQIQSLSHIRGRSLPKVFFINDEAQNLRPLDVKTIITRCGEGTKVIFTGDLDQIDTPFLDAESNGLAYLISRYINEPEFCYLRMKESARSSMADKAARLL